MAYREPPEPAFIFLYEEGEPAGMRIVRCNKQILANGPIGDKQQGNFYREVISCEAKDPLVGPGDIGTIHTSCAVYAGSVLYWCGSPDKERLRPGVVGWPMFGGWLGSLSMRHPAWVRYTGNEQPPQGALFYIEHPKRPNNNHVGFFLHELEPGVWETAEGGGGDGTECALRKRVLTDFDDETLYDFDPKLRRVLKGWWHPDRLGLEDVA